MFANPFRPLGTENRAACRAALPVSDNSCNRDAPTRLRVDYVLANEHFVLIQLCAHQLHWVCFDAEPGGFVVGDDSVDVAKRRQLRHGIPLESRKRWLRNRLPYKGCNPHGLPTRLRDTSQSPRLRKLFKVLRSQRGPVRQVRNRLERPILARLNNPIDRLSSSPLTVSNPNRIRFPTCGAPAEWVRSRARTPSCTRLPVATSAPASSVVYSRG